MSEFTDCIICNNKVRLHNSTEVIDVQSNVRAFHKKKFAVWRCSFCNSIHSKQDIDFAYFYKNYPLYNLKNRLFMNFYLSRRLKRLKQLGLKKEDSILDFGCGSGNMVNYLHLVGYKNAIGYDKYNIKFSDKKTLDHQYDCIICQDVLEHSQKPQLLLEKLVKLLKIKGILSIGTTNADYIKLSNPEKFLLPLHQPYHRHIFSEKSLILLANKMGLKVKKIYHRYYTDSLLPFVNHRFRTEYSLKKGNMLEPIYGKKIDFKTIFTPKIMFYAIFGYFFSPQTEMEILFQLSD